QNGEVKRSGLRGVCVCVCVCVCVVDLQEQMQRAIQLEQERRRAEDEAARLESDRQAALLAKEELARQAEDQMNGQEQLVRLTHSHTLTLTLTLTLHPFPLCNNLEIYLYIFGF